MAFKLKSKKPRNSKSTNSSRGMSKKLSVGMAVPAIAALVGLAFTGTAAPSHAAETTPVSPNSSLTGWLHTEGASIKDANGQTQVLKAVSWFGLETPDCVPHGLWTLKMDDGLKNIKSMGFNTIRLPYSNECITTGKVSTDTNFWANPDLKGLTPLQVMDNFIAKAKANGLNIILDRHRPSSASQSPLWYTSAVSESKWISDWTMLADRYKDDSTVIGVDLHNEPNGSAKWGSGNTANDWQMAATRAGNAIQAVNPKLLVVVEGVESVGDDYYWWGGNLAGAKAKPVVLNTPNQVVYSPHDYPQSVYNQKWFSDANYPNNLESVWDAHWGYLVKENIAPVLIGEFGTKLATDSDKQWLNKMVGYIKDNGISYTYWSFNPNSGDTGGLVGTDWRTPEQAKLDALAPILTPEAPVSSPSPTASPSATATATASPTATVTPTASATATPSDTATASAPATTDPAAGAISVKATAPTFWAGAYSIPTVEGVQYKVNGSYKLPGYYTDSSQLSITAEAAPGYSLTGTTSWSRVGTPVSSPSPTATATATATAVPTVIPTASPTASASPSATATATASPTATATASATPSPTATATTPVPTTDPTPAPAPANISSTWKTTSSWAGGYVANLSITALADAKTWQLSWDDPYATSITNQWGMKCTVASPKITCVGTDWTTSLKKGQVVSAGIQVNSSKPPVNPVLSY